MSDSRVDLLVTRVLRIKSGSQIQRGAKIKQTSKQTKTAVGC